MTTGERPAINWNAAKWFLFGMAAAERENGIAIALLVCGLVAMVFEQAHPAGGREGRT